MMPSHQPCSFSVTELDPKQLLLWQVQSPPSGIQRVLLPAHTADH
jgi:hypothetical protein